MTLAGIARKPGSFGELESTVGVSWDVGLIAGGIL